MKRHHLARVCIHGDPDPLRVGFLLHKAGHFIGCHLQALDHDVACAGDWVDVKMIGQGLDALDEKPQKPLEGDPHRATNAAQGNPFPPQAFDKTDIPQTPDEI
jgi:hypothetical protein